MLLRSSVNRLGTTYRCIPLLFGMLLFAFALSLPTLASAQRVGRHRSTVAHSAVTRSTVARSAASAKPLEILGLRPGISLDSVRSVLSEAGVRIREVREDSVSRAFQAPGVKIFVVDSIMCRLTYMRMSFLFEGAQSQLRRLTLTPRASAIATGQTDDVNSVLLLYFGEQWGKPEINFDPPACFKWRTGNIEAKGYIRRGYPIWTLEG